jgi:hypothetical protein
MDYRDRILVGIADRECKRLSRGAIRYLQSIQTGLLSGEDSLLGNAWDEVCVQVQDDESFYWWAYQQTIEAFVRPKVQELPLPTKQAIWLQTRSGEDWERDEAALEEVPAFEDDIVDHIVQGFVLHSAVNWTNDRIRAYLA